MAQSRRSANLTELVRRPDVGRAGRRVKIVANFYPVKFQSDVSIYHYDVDIKPTVPQAIGHMVFEHFETTQREALEGIGIAFDGSKNLYTTKKLWFAQSWRSQITLPEENDKPSKKLSTFKIKIQVARTIDLHVLSELVEGNASTNTDYAAAITMFDTLLRHRPARQLTTVGRSLFTGKGASLLPNGLEAWFGYFQSLRPATGRLLVNLDTSITAFYQSGNLINIMVNFLKLKNPSALQEVAKDVKQMQRLDRFLRGLKFRVNHRNQLARKFKVARITPTPASRTMFNPTGEDEEMNVAAYFHKRHNKTLKFPFLPCIVERPGVFFPFEVCEIVPGQHCKRRLDPEQMQAMISVAAQRPEKRRENIQKGLKTLDYANNPDLELFGLRVSEKMTEVNSRVIDPPIVSYHAQSGEATIRPSGGAWNMRNKRVKIGATLNSWVVVVFSTGQPPAKEAVLQFIRELCVTCASTGMNVVARDPPMNCVSAHTNIEACLKTAYMVGQRKYGKPTQLILCVLPTSGVQLYGEIKRISDTVIGVPTQCMQSSFIARPNKQYCANICIKINIKLGGTNAILDQRKPSGTKDESTMVMGADVVHPPPGDTVRPSIAAVVASRDAWFSQHSSFVSVQEPRTEIIAELEKATIQALRSYVRNNGGKKPARIIFYRDGVSEGQFAIVASQEIRAVQTACYKFEPKYEPKLTFLVVQKRHHARLFSLDDNKDRSGNCLPGTVVDTDITRPYEFDFYLLSHAGIQGTSRPAHYCVLYDDNNFKADDLQEFTYQLCHLFARATRSVSLVPAVYYADLLAARARFYSSSENISDADSLTSDSTAAFTYGNVCEGLQDRLYFL